MPDELRIDDEQPVSRQVRRARERADRKANGSAAAALS